MINDKFEIDRTILRDMIIIRAIRYGQTDLTSLIVDKIPF